MDRSGEFSKGAIALVVLLSMVLSGMIFMVTAPEPTAKMAEEKDDYGYYWMDNNDPDPKVEYNWMNVRGVGTELEIYGSLGYADIVLPSWQFPLYGSSYDTIYVGSRGLIWFEDLTYAPSDYSNGMPNSNDPNPSIAVGWGYPYNDYNSYGGVHYLTGQDNIGKWVCIEWNTNNYQMTYEVILWDSGLIKMQYNNMGTYSSNGNSISAGIENSDAEMYTVYSTYGQANMRNGLAIEFSYGTTTIDNYQLLNGGGPNNHTAFAENGLYQFSFDVMSSEGYGDLSTMKIFFGPPSLNIYARYNIVGGLGYWSVGGGGEFMIVNTTLSDQATVALANFSGIKAHLFVEFLFDIPLDGNISVTLWGRGKMALPRIREVEDALYLDSVVDLDGKVVVYNEAGDPLVNEAYTKENENITFTGVKLVYNSTHTMYPPNSSFIFKLIDDELVEYFDYNSSARNMSIIFKMPSLAIRKEFNLFLVYGDGGPFPDGKFLGTFPQLAFRVDDSVPIAPASLVIKADSFKDKQRDFDNDDLLFISWSSVKDSGSGVARYRIGTTYAPGDDSVSFVDSKVTQYIWNGTTEGVFRIFVWAEDGVGHAGEWKETSIIIDKRDVFFTEFSPDPRDVPWIRTLTPDLTIRVKDNLTISDAITGVRPSTIEYQVSTNGPDKFEEWISADLHDDPNIKPVDTIDVKLKPRFVEGTENYIHYRAKDYAGNGFSHSDTYKLQIDVTPVSVEDFFPTPNVWHDLDTISSRDVECYLRDDTSGIRTNMIYYRISNRYDAKNETYDWVTGIPQQKGWEKLPARDWDRMDGNKLVHIHFSYDGFQEGDQNFIQFMFRDEAGNGNYQAYFGDKMTLSDLYQIKVNTRPVAKIKSPHPLQTFFITDLITLDGSDSYDVDVDAGNLKYEWFCKELNKTLGNDMILENVRFPAKGWYNITLYVGDSVHRYDPNTGIDKRSTDKVRIMIDVWVPDPTKDTDKDGMNDAYEFDNLLDPMDPKDAGEDSDLDGYTNIQEYKAHTDPWDPLSKPVAGVIETSEVPAEKAPFQIWLFMALLVAAILVAAAIILIGYLRIHKGEQTEQTEEAEEEAMLATPQLDIPTMPPQVPMIDTSVPTLPPSEQAAPPLMEEQPYPEEQIPQPYPEEQVPQQEAPVEPPVPQEQVPGENPVLYEPAPVESPNPFFEGQQ